MDWKKFDISINDLEKIGMERSKLSQIFSKKGRKIKS